LEASGELRADNPTYAPPVGGGGSGGGGRAKVGAPRRRAEHRKRAPRDGRRP